MLDYYQFHGANKLLCGRCILSFTMLFIFIKIDVFPIPAILEFTNRINNITVSPFEFQSRDTM